MAGDATEVLTDPSANIFGVGQEEVPHQCIESNPGDAVFFSHQLFHASFGGGVRHMFTLNFRAALPSDQEAGRSLRRKTRKPSQWLANG